MTAGLIEYDTLQRLDTLRTIAVSLAEEAAKLIAPLAILLFTHHRRPVRTSLHLPETVGSWDA